MAMEQPLSQYIQEHIDENGFYTETDLPDSSEYPYLPEAGHTDAFYYMANMPESRKDAEKLLRYVRAYSFNPTAAASSRLCQALQDMTMAEYCDPFAAAFSQEPLTPAVQELAHRLFATSTQREPLKFALLLFGLCGMDKLQQQEPELWRSIIDVARCEEFTFSFLYSCRLSGGPFQKAVWELLACTKGWGKVFCIIDCQCRNEGERLWLLKNGPDIDVEYPPLSIKLLQATRLENFLQQPAISYGIYKNAVSIVGNFLLLLLHYSPVDVRENYNLQSVDLYSLLCRLLRHAACHAVLPEDLLDISSLATSLRHLADEERLYSLSPNQLQELIACCDKMVFSRNWQPEIRSRLIEKDEVNYLLADFACELEIDVWPQLFRYWQQHPEEYTLLPYLLAYEGGGRAEKVLSSLMLQLPLYKGLPHALIVPLRYLQTHPGQGEAIICAALDSLYELVRSCACDVLEEWGPAYLSPLLRDALTRALQSGSDELLKIRFAAILQGKRPDTESLLRQLKKRRQKKA